MSPTPADPLLSALRVRALRLRVCLAVLAMTAAFALVVVIESHSQLSTAYTEAGHSRARALARSFVLREEALSYADLTERLQELRDRVDGVVRVDAFAIAQGAPQKIATTDNRTLADRTEELELAALRDGRPRYHSVRQHGRHLLEYVFALSEHGRRFGAVAIYSDLSPLDRAQAHSRRRLVLTTLAVAALMTLSLILLLRQSLFRPLDRLRATTRRLASGELDARLDWHRHDEIGAVARDFDAMAAALQRNHERLAGLALTDPLTGLANHRAFRESLTAELERARREVYDIALIAIDIDRFKLVNDSSGHAVGDEALRLVAQALRAQTRPGDIVGRVGGDEFVVALVRAGSEIAETVVNRVRTSVASMGIGPERANITLSVGVAEFPRDAEGMVELAALADAALYAAKQGGRDRCVVWSPQGVVAQGATTSDPRRDAAGLLNTIHALAVAVDVKVGHTHEHSHRVGSYAAALGASLGIEGDHLRRLRTAGVLHDVGKIGVADTILLKPGRLTEAEYEEIKRHSELGAEIIRGVGLGETARWVRHLHERWDGTGYPDGLAGEDIPLESRILAVADALEAMTGARVYRRSWPLEEALAELERAAGTHFDPRLAHALADLVRRGTIRIAAPNEVPA
jgi:diguanylate cyclase (GGDEF)-like protein